MAVTNDERGKGLSMWLRRAAALVPGARWLKRRIFGAGEPSAAFVPFLSPTERGDPPRADKAALTARYHAGEIADLPDTFVLYRIIGNDLPPRHGAGQSVTNLKFILEHEPELPRCLKRFVVNRIVDPGEEAAVLALLDRAGLPYIRIPFDREAYRSRPWDVEGVPPDYAPWTERFAKLPTENQEQILMRLYRHKNNYVMNNNGARNVALRDGRTAAKWVLPWDGSCFVTAAAWSEIVADVSAAPELPCFVVPMARIADNAALLTDSYRPEANEEPQIIFRSDSQLEFDSGFYYGRRPKVEMLWRLGVPGCWDSFQIKPWDKPCPDYAEEAGAFASTGWVARLSSRNRGFEHGIGVEAASREIRERGIARVEAVKRMLDAVDETTFGLRGTGRACFIPAGIFRGDREFELIIARLHDAAEKALLRGPYSVVDKQTLPPSGNRHDYWHPAPYYWPHPLRLPGLPYVRRDGRRAPGTVLYAPFSARYDRTRLQGMFDDTFQLTLAWRCCGDRRYAERAAELVRTWFVTPETAMNPHLDYAQVRWGHSDNKGSGSGVIEMKDLYFLLDAMRVLQAEGWLVQSDQTCLDRWLRKYLRWLQSSPQGRAERTSENNHGTYYDLQVCTIAAHLGDVRLVRETLRDSRCRILQQFDRIGVQQKEMERVNTAHYCCFNLQGWIHLACLAEAFGEDLWSFEARDGRGLRRAIRWMLEHINKPWPHPQADAFDTDRFYPIYYSYVVRYGDVPGIAKDEIPLPSAINPVFSPYDGILPFWQLALLPDVNGSLPNRAGSDES